LKKQLQNVKEQNNKKSKAVFFFGGGCSFDLTSIVSTINAAMEIYSWRHQKMGEKDQVYFVKQLLHHQRDLGGPLLYRAKA